MESLIKLDNIDYLTATLALITAIYAFITHRILIANQKAVKVMERQIEESTRPYVLAHAYTPMGSQSFELQITNLGKSVAYDVSLKLDKEIYIGGVVKNESKFSELPIFRDGMPSMAPGFKISFYLGTSFKVLSGDENQVKSPKEFKITISYRNGRGRKYEDFFNVNIGVFEQSAIHYPDGTQSLKKIADMISKIENTLRQKS